MREAITTGAVVGLFATAAAIEQNPALLHGQAVSEISPKAAASLSETSTPQGLIAVCSAVDVPISQALAGTPRLVAVLVEPNDPGNAGTVIRTADAAGADAVVLVGGVDLYNGKTVRASAGSLFHLPITTLPETGDLLALAGAAGLQSLATSGSATTDLDRLEHAGGLSRPTLWLFGSEAHGLPGEVLDGADLTVRVPIHGRAESLNLAAAAAICLYASARSQRR